MTVEEPAPEPAAQDTDALRPETPAARFAADLRGLREAAGSPSYRQLARVMHYSPSTIADATAGRRLPTEPVVRALATACKADPDVWANKLRDAVKAQAEAVALAGDSARNTPPPSGDVELQSERLAAGDAVKWRRRTVRWFAGTALACAFLGVGYGIGSATTHPSSTPSSSHESSRPLTTTTTPSPAYSYPALDGADPVAAGCAGDAQLIDKSALMRDGVQVGALELKYSVRCHAGWARVYLYPTSAPKLTGMLASVEVIAQDGTAALIAARLHMDVPNYTDVVQPHGGCLRAVAVLGPDTAAPAHAEIGCDAPPTTE